MDIWYKKKPCKMRLIDLVIQLKKLPTLERLEALILEKIV
jgi:hypothetical protein